MKKIAIGAKPISSKSNQSTDAWVKDRLEEPMKRLTIDVPIPLHKRIKSQCAMQGANMAEAIRDLLEREFPVDAAAKLQPSGRKIADTLL